MSDQLKDEEEVLKRDRPEGSKREPTVNENKPETSEPCLLYTSPSPRDS